jgi:hypothetical protein
MDSIRASEAPDAGSIPAEATKPPKTLKGGFIIFTREIKYSISL